MRAFVGKFTKADGTSRTMYFARLEDLPPGFLDAKTTGTGTSPTQKGNKELVWDLQKQDFRVFDFSQPTTAFEYDENNLV